MRKKHIVVTGGAGFIGSCIARRLIREGYRVIVLDNFSTGIKNNIPAQADFIKIDLGKKDCYSLLKNIKAEAVFHLGEQSSGEASFFDPLYDLRSHVLGTYWLLEWCRKRDVRRFLYASSMSVYGDAQYLPVDEKHPLQPKTFYAAGKVSAEAYIKLYQNLGIETTVFRMFSIYGPGQNLSNKTQGMVSIYLSFMLEGSPILVKGSPKRFRDFLYIDDAVDAWISAFNNPVSYAKVYNLGGGRRTRVAELLQAIKAAFGYKHYPIKYAQETPGDQFGLLADISLIEKDLSWRPKISLGLGLKKMVDFEKEKTG